MTEAGRQPWVIYGIMRTRDAVTPAGGVAYSLAGFSLLYVALGIALILLLRRLAGGMPTSPTHAPPASQPSPSMRGIPRPPATPGQLGRGEAGPPRPPGEVGLVAELLAEIVGAVALAVLVAYAVLAGADFGGGVWDLMARGPRAADQRAAIASAMGPVWEANHVWLIFLIVLLFTCFPAAFAVLSVAFFVPFHLVLLGVVLRGAAFVFRAHGHAVAGGGPGAVSAGLSWGHVFGGASTITPFLLGACLGAVSNGHVRTDGAGITPGIGLGLARSAGPGDRGALAGALRLPGGRLPDPRNRGPGP